MEGDGENEDEKDGEEDSEPSTSGPGVNRAAVAAGLAGALP